MTRMSPRSSPTAARASATPGAAILMAIIVIAGSGGLYARLGTTAPNFCFAGHTDVVPVAGQAWTSDPFCLRRAAGKLYGRGACDMKGAIAAFVAAAARQLKASPGKGSISLLITGDEEGPAVDGTVKVLEWMAAKRTAATWWRLGSDAEARSITLFLMAMKPAFWQMM